ncbi:tRNA (cytidine(34)-2'-O)-methyltransferase [Pelagibacteraceae bacterium]|nr:tRNA (cytidine(34)-2'-O)-methyltransferase [Pelagibacteraceae bacterium]
MINVALYQPDIPQNTAAIIRTCACFDIKLEIIKPAGFVLNEKKLNRIYMDYVKNCEIKIFESFESFINAKQNNRVILFTTKSKKYYYNFQFEKGDTLLFGSESHGVSEEVHNIIKNKMIIPIKKDTRSLNLSSSVAIAASEALRQISLKN